MKSRILSALRALLVPAVAFTLSCVATTDVPHDPSLQAESAGGGVMRSCPHEQKVCASHGRAVCCPHHHACCEDHHGRPYCGTEHGCGH